MDPSLVPLLDGVKSDTLEDQSEAVFQIAMLLEKNTRPCDELGFYETVLSQELLNLKLSKSSQKRIVQQFSKIENLQRILPSVFWALGKALPEVGAPLLIELVQKYEKELTSEAAYQALISLENFLDGSRKNGLSEEVTDALSEENLDTFLRHASSMEDAKVARRTAAILRKVKPGQH